MSHVHARVSLRIAVSRRVGRERTSRHPDGDDDAADGHRADPRLWRVRKLDVDPDAFQTERHRARDGMGLRNTTQRETSWARESGTRTTSRSNRRTSSTRTCGNPGRGERPRRVGLADDGPPPSPSRGQTSRSASPTRNQRHRRHHQRIERFSRAVRRGAPGFSFLFIAYAGVAVVRPTKRRHGVKKIEDEHATRDAAKKDAEGVDVDPPRRSPPLGPSVVNLSNDRRAWSRRRRRRRCRSTVVVASERVWKLVVQRRRGNARRSREKCARIGVTRRATSASHTRDEMCTPRASSEWVSSRLYREERARVSKERPRARRHANLSLTVIGNRHPG